LIFRIEFDAKTSAEPGEICDVISSINIAGGSFGTGDFGGFICAYISRMF
jgi:hypothetical protein